MDTLLIIVMTIQREIQDQDSVSVQNELEGAELPIPDFIMIKCHKNAFLFYMEDVGGTEIDLYLKRSVNVCVRGGLLRVLNNSICYSIIS